MAGPLGRVARGGIMDEAREPGIDQGRKGTVDTHTATPARETSRPRRPYTANSGNRRRGGLNER